MHGLSQIEPKRLMLAQISICQGCCCGKTDKGHPEVPVEWLKQEWKLRGLLKRVHLTITGCLGPCDVPNVIAITSSEGTQWLARITTRRQYLMIAVSIGLDLYRSIAAFGQAIKKLNLWSTSG